MGIGRPVPGGEARSAAYHEARCAVEAVALGVDERAGGPSNGAEWVGIEIRPRRSRMWRPIRDLGSFQLLLSLQEDEALRLFCDSILGPIEASEGPYGGELMRSLEAFIEVQRSVGAGRQAALLPPAHAALSDPACGGADRPQSPQSARDRIEFWLALRGRELVA